MTAAAADPLSGPRPQTHWPAPAKLNLFLHVIGRRADGYHELQTLFQLIDLCDTVAIRVREDGRIERPVGPPAARSARPRAPRSRSEENTSELQSLAYL